VRKLEENEKPLTPEEIETQKKIVDDLYKKEKEEREQYLKSFEVERKAAFLDIREKFHERKTKRTRFRKNGTKT
jgi:hypothetical protein